MAETVNITYETLFEILRREKNREELQELSGSFYSDVINYLEEKKNLLEDVSKRTDLAALEEKEKLLSQFQTVSRILKDLYERREKKIINMAINKSRTVSNIVSTSSLLGEEKNLFNTIVGVLDKFRNGVLANLLNGKQPGVEEEKTVEEKKEEKTTMLVRFLHSVPKFVGEDMKIYGPFAEEDIANLPAGVASVLINKERAEEVD